jgi:PAS domain S-box-containing protein
MATSLRVLIVEDRPADVELILHQLRKDGFIPDWQCVDTKADYVAALEAALDEDIDVILADYSLPQFDALGALRLLRESGLDIPFIVVAGSISEEVAVECMKRGVADFLLKDHLARLGEAIRSARREKILRDERRWTERALRESEEQYRGLFERVPVGLCRTTPDGQILDANSALVAMLGYRNRHNLMAHNIADGYEDLEERRQWQLLMARDGEVRGYETRWRRQDGGFIWVRESARAIQDDEGQVLYYEGVVEDITERKLAEEALRKSEARYRSLFEDSPIALSEEDFSEVRRAINELRESGLSDLRAYLEEHPEEVRRCAAMVRILDANRHCLRLFGAKSIEELQEEFRQGLDRVSTRYSLNVFREELIALAAGKTEFWSETVYRTLQGDEIYVALSLNAAPGHEETWSKILVSVVDISERVRAERELQRHTERLRTLRAIDGAILAAWSPEKIAQSALRHMQRLVPYWRASVVVFERDRHKATVLATYGSGETRLGSGMVLPLEQIGSLEELEQGKVLVVEDVMALPAATLGAGPSTSQQARDSADLGQVAADGTSVDVPSAPSAMARALHFEDLRSYVTVPLVTQGELVGFLNLGADRPHAFTSEHVDIANEVANQFAVAVRQARLQEEIQRHVAKLEQRVAERTAELSVVNAALVRASRLKDEFLASMSHELRTPLNAILGISEGLQDEVYGSLNERQLRSLRTIEQSGRHLLSLINDILDVSKIEAGEVKLEILPISIKSVCQASLGLVKQTAHKKQIRLSLTLDSAVTTVHADERRLKQILVNLLSNAVKFTSEGGEVSLEVAVDAEREVIHFAVQDTGIGISEEEMGRLFQPFVQIDSSLSREHGGTGLGLVMVQRLAELHGGCVSVESEVGQGSRFTVSLPWRVAEEQGSVGVSKGEENTTLPTPIPSHPHTRAVILLAEDNEDSITTFRDYLLDRGYRVIVGRNGGQAVTMARKERPDLILMDIQMPGMDGLEAMHHIREDPDPGVSNVPIVALTALAMPGDRERCLEMGASEYLSKPVGLKQLVDVIESQLAIAGP